MIFKSFEFKPAPRAPTPATRPRRHQSQPSRAPCPGPPRLPAAGRRAPLAARRRHGPSSMDHPHRGQLRRALERPDADQAQAHDRAGPVRGQGAQRPCGERWQAHLHPQDPGHTGRRAEPGQEAVLAAARDKLAEEVRGKVVGESDAQIAGYEGHAYRLEVADPKPAVVAARAAIVGKRTVVLSVIGDRAAVAGPSAERFLDSFRVGN